MEATYRAMDGKLLVKLDAADLRGLVQQISEFEDFFGETKCAACESTNVRPKFRQAKGYDFYAVQCADCGARLSFGQTKEGHKLFAKRKDDNGDWLGKYGWEKYQEQRDREGDTATAGTNRSRSSRDDDDRQYF